MIIETNKTSEFGRKIAFCDKISIKFDSFGKAKISDKDAKTLFEAGYDWLFEEGTREVKEPIKQDDIDKAVEAELEIVQKQLTDSLDRITRREQELETVKAELVEWKKVATELGEKLEKGAETSGTEEKGLQDTIKENEIHIGLLELKDSELKVMADKFKVECKDSKFKHVERLALIDKLLEANKKLKQE